MELFAAEDALNKTQEFNSELYCRVHYRLLKKKMIKIEIYEKYYFFTYNK